LHFGLSGNNSGISSKLLSQNISPSHISSGGTHFIILFTLHVNVAQDVVVVVVVTVVVELVVVVVSERGHCLKVGS
jgi:hypothetical protein